MDYLVDSLLVKNQYYKPYSNQNLSDTTLQDSTSELIKYQFNPETGERINPNP